MKRTTALPLKTRRKKMHAIEIPILPELAKIIEASPTGDLTFLMTAWGKPFTANGFGGWFRDRCNEAGLPQCSAHGLRKAGAAIMAEYLDAEDGDIKDALGHYLGTTGAERYVRKVNLEMAHLTRVLKAT